jgi:hypothetical protein
MDEQDPKRRDMQPPIPTHLSDTAPPEDEDKIAGGAPVSGRKPGDPPSGSPGLASGHAADEGVGGAGLGKAPGDGDAGTRDQDTKAGGAQDKP